MICRVGADVDETVVVIDVIRIRIDIAFPLDGLQELAVHKYHVVVETAQRRIFPLLAALPPVGRFRREQV